MHNQNGFETTRAVRISKTKNNDYVLQPLDAHSDSFHPAVLHSHSSHPSQPQTVDEYPTCVAKGCLEQEKYVIPGKSYRTAGRVFQATTKDLAQKRKWWDDSTLATYSLGSKTQNDFSNLVVIDSYKS